MNTKFKPLGLVAAVAAATAGYSGVVSAQATTAGNSLGDLAIVPYYTVREGFGTGVHLTNTSDRTQVVKFRLRRGADSMDALDFNIVMSPKDVWTGFINDNGENIVVSSQDTSCTVPAMTNNQFVMPSIYRVGAEEGYIELIAMGSPALDEAGNDTSALSRGAVHVDDVPVNCEAVRSNFFSRDPALATNPTGVEDSLTTLGYDPADAEEVVETLYEDSGDVLKASFFIRDSDAGLEFGNDAVHIAGFLADASITNQQFGLGSGDLQGFDYPDLDGGAPGYTDTDTDPTTTSVGAVRGKYNELRAALGGVSVINDWSANEDLNVGTDWVITVPGQYTMLDLFEYFGAAAAVGTSYAATDAVPDEGEDNDVTDLCLAGDCDFRDIPLTATFDVYNREERTLAQPGGDLVVSPQLPGETVRTLLPAEVNVVTWGVEPVLDSANPVSVQTPEGSPYGWAELTVVGANKGAQVCDPSTTSAESPTPAFETPRRCYEVDDAGTLIPMVGFVAWERSFAANPDANYGRIVEHSYGVASSS